MWDSERLGGDVICCKWICLQEIQVIDDGGQQECDLLRPNEARRKPGTQRSKRRGPVGTKDKSSHLCVMDIVRHEVHWHPAHGHIAKEMEPTFKSRSPGSRTCRQPLCYTFAHRISMMVVAELLMVNFSLHMTLSLG